MRHPTGRAARLAAILALLAAPSRLPAAEPVPLRAFFGKPAIGALALSPSGRFLAVTVPGENDRLELRVADLDEEPWVWKGVAWLKDFDIGDVHWLNDRRLVFDAFDSQAADVWSGTRGLWAVDADGKDQRLLIDAEVLGHYGNYAVKLSTPGREVLGGEWELEGVLPGDGDDVLIREWRWSSLRATGWLGLGRTNTRKPKLLRLTTGAPDGAQIWITDEQGVPRYFESLIDARRKVYRRDAEGGWEEVASFPDLDDGGWSPRFLVEGALLVSTQPPGASAQVLTTWDPATRRLGAPPVLAAKGFDVGYSAYPLVDEESQRLLGWRYRLDTLYTRWLDERMQRFQAAIDRALPGKVNRIAVRRPASARRWLISSLSDHEPPMHSVFEPATGRLKPVGSAHPEIPTERMGRRSMERVKARDGLEIPVYLTRPARPAGASAGPLPAVVYVHGGPWARTRLEWSASSLPQFLASRGYLVIEPDFRGSSGYGVAHERAGRRQWGLAMQDDLSDALAWAIGKGLVDKDRVCIMGASYGGYAALMGPAHTPGAYRCAISWVAPTNLARLLEEDAKRGAFEGLSGRLMHLYVGDPSRDAERLRRTSPVHRAADIRVPVLAAWGKLDRRIPLEHGQRFRDAAAEAGVALEYVEYDGEGHSWLRTETWLDFMGRAEKLLARTIGKPR